MIKGLTFNVSYTGVSKVMDCIVHAIG